MLKLIAILVLSSQLAVAVETDAGYVEATFPNTAAGAEQVIEFAEKTVGEPDGGVRIVVGWLYDQDNDEHIVKALAALGIKHGMASPSDIQAAMAENRLSSPSALAVALADEKRFGFIYRRAKK